MTGLIVKLPLVPKSGTLWGAPVALSAIATAAERVPAALGVNVTLIVQLLDWARLVPQVLLCAKSVLLTPVTLMLPSVSGAAPVFVTVTFCGALVVPVA